MSPAERFVRHQKLKTDRAISQAYGRLATHLRARATFEEMLGCVRRRSPGLLLAPTVLDRHLGVEALVNLSRFARAHVRTTATWSGCAASWRGAVNALAHHLLSDYPIPAFLAAAWYATDRHADAKRRWFIAHARGASFRSLSVPIRLTRKMEHIFLGSADHLEIDYALRRAELLGLGANATLADAGTGNSPGSGSGARGVLALDVALPHRKPARHRARAGGTAHRLRQCGSSRTSGRRDSERHRHARAAAAGVLSERPNPAVDAQAHG